MSVTKLTNDNVENIMWSKLTGPLPALDGSALTGITGGTTVMKAASDPANDTNPADGVGTMYLNTTTGNMFICIDATTDQNGWNNAGPGTGGVSAPSPYFFGGTISGYIAGGQVTDNSYNETIDKFSFQNEASVSDHGDMAQGRFSCSGFDSSTHGITVGGRWTWPGVDTIEKYSFTNTNGATNVGNMAEGVVYHSSNSTVTYGYVVGGYAVVTKIEKYSFATDAHTGTVGNLLLGRRGGHSANSETHGYTSNGYYGVGAPEGTNWLREVEKFAFASESTSINVGNSTRYSSHGGAFSSSTYGYSCGGHSGTGTTQGPNSNIIDKFSFSSDGDSTDVSDLVTVQQGAYGHSSETSGYLAAGSSVGTGAGATSAIQKFIFASEANTVIVGNMTLARLFGATHNY